MLYKGCEGCPFLGKKAMRVIEGGHACNAIEPARIGRYISPVRLAEFSGDNFDKCPHYKLGVNRRAPKTDVNSGPIYSSAADKDISDISDFLGPYQCS